MKIMTKIMLFLLSIFLMGTAEAPVHTSNLYMGEMTNSYSFDEKATYDNNFTAGYQVGLCKAYIDDLVSEKGKENISWEDFDDFSYTDIGSGQYVYEYNMADGSHLHLCGSDLSIPPTTIYIIDADGKTIQIK